MAYHFSAEKRGSQDLQTLNERLSHFKLIEFFPVEVARDSLTLGISIPFKGVDDPRLDDELENVMIYLISEHGFQVTDLFSGRSVNAGDISGLAKHISRT